MNQNSKIKIQNPKIKKKNFQLPFEILKSTRAKSVKVLGVWFNDTASWSTHIEAITKLASRRLFALRVLKPNISGQNLKLVYCSLVRSILEYCAPAFICLSKSDSCRLNRVQNRFHRLLCSKNCKKPCLLDLDVRRATLSLKFLAKILSHDQVLHSLLPPVSHSGRFLLPHRNTSRRSKTFFLQACELFNSEMFKRLC